ncbi:macro domain-like protein [Pholiota conissans]|uniref:Macro domain-like protein n=1 Tax=Pholiota conissans TaxID=109636 RepID=A0A9P5YQD8_9AGAR|nr:macro domain-like protein [Pholiota conissans]
MAGDAVFTLLDLSTPLTEAWGRAITQHITEAYRDNFSVVRSILADVAPPHDKFDCIVSPANSYGRLDGGFDYFLAEALSPDDIDAPTHVAQAELYRRWKGFAPPGSRTLVPLKGSVCENNVHDCAYIALCPTMRVPEGVNWNREIVYNCVWSLLISLDHHNKVVEASGEGTKISRVLMPGLATGVGGVPPERCAQQTALAIRDFIDACANEEKWSSLKWESAIAYAEDCRRTYRDIH